MGPIVLKINFHFSYEIWKSTGTKWTIFQPLLLCGSWKLEAGRGIYLWKNLGVKNSVLKIFYFLNVLSYQGEHFLFFFVGSSKEILELVDQKWTQKSTLLANLTPVIWPFWGSKKSFSGLFRSFFRLVWEVFRHCLRLYKAYFWVYFQL